MSSSENQVGGVVNALQREATIGPSTVTNVTLYEESCLADEQKKITVEEVYSDGRFKHEDEYEIIRVVTR